MEYEDLRQLRQEAIECGLQDEVTIELGKLVRAGLLEVGVTGAGEALFWPTENGARELGMELVDPDCMDQQVR